MAQTQGPKLDDLIANEFDPEYCRDVAVVRNATGGAVAIANTFGMFVKTVSNVYCIGLAADAASATGVICSNYPLALADATTDTQKHVILARGPLVLRQDGMAAVDAVGAAVTKATVIAALLALNVPIRVSPQPTQKTTQTT